MKYHITIQILFFIATTVSYSSIESCDLYDGGEYFNGLPDNVERSGNTVCNTQDIMAHPFKQPDRMDFAQFRASFPIFQQQVDGHPFIYFDSASTAQMPQPVFDAIAEYYQEYKANVGRGLYSFAEKSTQMFEAARAKVARFLSSDVNEIVFTTGSTGSINLALHVWAEQHIGQGDEIIISQVEHNANFIPWLQLAKRKNAVMKYAPIDAFGRIDIQELQKLLSSKTKLVAITHQSNILGAVNDVATIGAMAHAVGAKILVDAAQSVAHQKIDVKALDCDFLVFSGHKLFGPTGVGVLYIHQRLFHECEPSNFGGGMVLEVSRDMIEYKPMPHCFEPGTQAIAQVIGLGAAIDFVEKSMNFEMVQEYETDLVLSVAQALSLIPEVTIISPVPAQGDHNNMVTFTTTVAHAYDVAQCLSDHGIAVRAGYHCVQPYHDDLGGLSSVRISICAYNTQQEVDYLIERLQKFFKD